MAEIEPNGTFIGTLGDSFFSNRVREAAPKKLASRTQLPARSLASVDSNSALTIYPPCLSIPRKSQVNLGALLGSFSIVLDLLECK
jgi:hypothetical protein